MVMITNNPSGSQHILTESVATAGRMLLFLLLTFFLRLFLLLFDVLFLLFFSNILWLLLLLLRPAGARDGAQEDQPGKTERVCHEPA